MCPEKLPETDVPGGALSTSDPEYRGCGLWAGDSAGPARQRMRGDEYRLTCGGFCPENLQYIPNVREARSFENGLGRAGFPPLATYRAL